MACKYGPLIWDNQMVDTQEEDRQLDIHEAEDNLEAEEDNHREAVDHRNQQVDHRLAEEVGIQLREGLAGLSATSAEQGELP